MQYRTSSFAFCKRTDIFCKAFQKNLCHKNTKRYYINYFYTKKYMAHQTCSYTNVTFTMLSIMISAVIPAMEEKITITKENAWKYFAFTSGFKYYFSKTKYSNQFVCNRYNYL